MATIQIGHFYKKLTLIKGEKMNRIELFYNNLNMSEYEIAAGLTNGEIEKPEWLSVTEDVDHLRIWDNEDKNASQSWCFIRVNYNYD